MISDPNRELHQSPKEISEKVDCKHRRPPTEWRCTRFKPQTVWPRIHNQVGLVSLYSMAPGCHKFVLNAWRRMNTEVHLTDPVRFLRDTQRLSSIRHQSRAYLGCLVVDVSSVTRRLVGIHIRLLSNAPVGKIHHKNTPGCLRREWTSWDPSGPSRTTEYPEYLKEDHSPKTSVHSDHEN